MPVEYKAIEKSTAGDTIPRGLTKQNISRSIFENLSHCFGIGIADICIDIDTSNRSGTVTLKVLSITLATLMIDAEHPGGSLKGDVGLAYANATVNVDFDAHVITTSGEACQRNPFDSDNCTTWTNQSYQW